MLFRSVEYAIGPTGLFGLIVLGMYCVVCRVFDKAFMKDVRSRIVFLVFCAFGACVFGLLMVVTRQPDILVTLLWVAPLAAFLAMAMANR